MHSVWSKDDYSVDTNSIQDLLDSKNSNRQQIWNNFFKQIQDQTIEDTDEIEMMDIGTAVKMTPNNSFHKSKDLVQQWVDSCKSNTSNSISTSPQLPYMKNIHNEINDQKNKGFEFLCEVNDSNTIIMEDNNSEKMNSDLNTNIDDMNNIFNSKRSLSNESSTGFLSFYRNKRKKLYNPSDLPMDIESSKTNNIINSTLDTNCSELSMNSVIPSRVSEKKLNKIDSSNKREIELEKQADTDIQFKVNKTKSNFLNINGKNDYEIEKINNRPQIIPCYTDDSSSSSTIYIEKLPEFIENNKNDFNLSFPEINKTPILSVECKSDCAEFNTYLNNSSIKELDNNDSNNAQTFNNSKIDNCVENDDGSVKNKIILSQSKKLLLKNHPKKINSKITLLKRRFPRLRFNKLDTETKDDYKKETILDDESKKSCNFSCEKDKRAVVLLTKIDDIKNYATKNLRLNSVNSKCLQKNEFVKKNNIKESIVHKNCTVLSSPNKGPSTNSIDTSSLSISINISSKSHMNNIETKNIALDKNNKKNNQNYHSKSPNRTITKNKTNSEFVQPEKVLNSKMELADYYYYNIINYRDNYESKSSVVENSANKLEETNANEISDSNIGMTYKYNYSRKFVFVSSSDTEDETINNSKFKKKHQKSMKTRKKNKNLESTNIEKLVNMNKISESCALLIKEVESDNSFNQKGNFSNNKISDKKDKQVVDLFSDLDETDYMMFAPGFSLCNK